MKTTLPPLARRSALLALAATVSLCTSRVHGGDEKITGPRTHENLAVYLIHGADRTNGKTYLTLQDALAQKKAVVRETGQVNQLVVENVSEDTEIYIQAGDIVKGGNQDRTLGTDLILGSKSKVPITAFCVEHGRWQKRGQESNEHFAAAADQVASKDLKLAVKQKKGQGEVWEKRGGNADQAEQQIGRTGQCSAVRFQPAIDARKQKGPGVGR